MSVLEELGQSIIEGRIGEIKEQVQKSLDNGMTAEDILQKGLLKGMETVGKRFAAEDMYIPEVMLSARTMHTALEILRPLLEAEQQGLGMKGKLLLGTVEGDIHDIGKSLVEMIFTANGFEVIDIGIDVPAEKFVEAVKEYQPDIVGMSALLTNTMPAMQQAVAAIEDAGLRKDGKLKILVGGAPVTEEYAKEIGADLYGENAIEGVEMVKQVLELTGTRK